MFINAESRSSGIMAGDGNWDFSPIEQNADATSLILHH
jgi:hypothetical protein